MAIDVAKGRYMLCHPPQSSDDAESTPSTPSDGTTARASPPQFRYGMIHDIESLFWIATWFLLRTHPPGTEVRPGILQSAANIFPRHNRIDDRIALLTTPDLWIQIRADVHEEFKTAVSRIRDLGY